jgi:hypothetical protein
MWLAEYLLCNHPPLVKACDMSMTIGTYKSRNNGAHVVLPSSLSSSSSHLGVFSIHTIATPLRDDHQLFAPLLRHCLEPVSDHKTTASTAAAVTCNGDIMAPLPLSHVRASLCARLIDGGVDMEQANNDGISLLLRCIASYGHDCGLIRTGANGMAALHTIKRLSVPGSLSSLSLYDAYINARHSELRDERMLIQSCIDDILIPVPITSLIYQYIPWWHNIPFNEWHTLLVNRLTRVTSLEQQCVNQSSLLSSLIDRITALESRF